MPKRAKLNAQAVAAASPQPESAQPHGDAPDVKKPTITEIFGPGGALEKCMPEGYEHRPSQLEMAELVEAAFREKRHLIVEAGTGTGKTLAYLIPAIRSGRRVVISTATKSLQEQLFEKDIPFLQKYFAPELKVAVMKGRGNFLCREKVYRMADQPMLKGLDEVDWFQQIRDWEKVTETGDRAELNFLPDDADLWQRLDARRDACTGSKCPEFNRCFLTAMHQRAAEADLIIVNHHLFFADLALKQDDFGSVLPEYGAVVFDEAHEIEDVASDYFGRQISNYRFDELARDAELAARVTKAGGPGLQKQIARMRERSRSFFEAFPAREGRFPFDKVQRAGFLEQNREAYDALINALKSLEAEIASLPAKPEELLNIARRGMELRGELKFLFESSEGNYVYWFERRNKGVFVAATPIDVSALLRERLFEPFETIVLTSATLAVEGRFDFLHQRLGTRHGPRARAALRNSISPNRRMLYIPATLPDVRDAGVPGTRGAGDRPTAGDFARARVLPVHQLQPDERFVRARAHARAFPAADAGLGAAVGAARKISRHARRGAFRHFQLLAGSGRPRRTAFLRDRGPAAVRRALRPDCRGARAKRCRRTAATRSRNIRCRRRCWRSSRASAG